MTKKIRKELTLMEYLDRMDILNEEGYDCFFEGQGDGTVKVIAEKFEFIDIRKIKK